VTEDKAPKEVTCRGGLMATEVELPETVDHNPPGMNTYADLSDGNKDAIVNKVKQFNAFFLALNDEFDFRERFNVSAGALALFREEADKHLRDYLEDGIGYNKRLDEVASDADRLAEPLFFLPMIGTINHLLSKLASLNSVDQ